MELIVNRVESDIRLLAKDLTESASLLLRVEQSDVDIA